MIAAGLHLHAAPRLHVLFMYWVSLGLQTPCQARGIQSCLQEAPGKGEDSQSLILPCSISRNPAMAWHHDNSARAAGLIFPRI